MENQQPQNQQEPTPQPEKLENHELWPQYSKFAIGGFIFGIFGMPLVPLPAFGLVATILSIKGLSQIKKEQKKGKNLAIIGLILGIAGTLWDLFMLIALAGILM